MKHVLSFTSFGTSRLLQANIFTSQVSVSSSFKHGYCTGKLQLPLRLYSSLRWHYNSKVGLNPGRLGDHWLDTDFIARVRIMLLACCGGFDIFKAITTEWVTATAMYRCVLSARNSTELVICDFICPHTTQWRKHHNPHWRMKPSFSSATQLILKVYRGPDHVLGTEEIIIGKFSQGLRCQRIYILWK